MPTTLNGETLPISEAVRLHPDWAANRIRFLEQALKTIRELTDSGLYVLGRLDNVEFKTQQEPEKDGE